MKHHSNHTKQSLTQTNHTGWCINTIRSPDDEHLMLETCREMKSINKYMKKCIRLVINKNLWRDARSAKYKNCACIIRVRSFNSSYFLFVIFFLISFHSQLNLFVHFFCGSYFLKLLAILVWCLMSSLIPEPYYEASIGKTKLRSVLWSHNFLTGVITRIHSPISNPFTCKLPGSQPLTERIDNDNRKGM